MSKQKEVTIEDLIKEASKYIEDERELDNIRHGYMYAKECHEGQFRKSGEPYIIHPLHVCMNLTKFNADESSLCAGLLHDVVEDTEYTLEQIRNEFNDDIAHLVDGVT